MKLNYDFDLASVVILVFILYWLLAKRGIQRKGNRIFLCMVVTALLSVIADMVPWMVGPPDGIGDDLFWLDFSHFWYLFLHSNLLPVILVYYIIYVVGLDYRLREYHFAMIAIPAVFGTLVLLFNFFTHKMFYYDDLGNYFHGPWFNITYCVAAFYLLLAILLLFMYRKALTGTFFIPLMTIIVMSIIPVVIQFYFRFLLVEVFCQSVGMLAALFTMEGKEDVTNPVTKVLSRYMLLSTARSCIQFEGELEILLIKLQDIRRYYTILGLEASTQILKEVAFWLDKRFKGRSCYDCDNGHFALVGEPITSEERRAIKDAVITRFQKTWGKGILETVIPVQLCNICLPSDVSSVNDLIMIMDQSFEGSSSVILEEQDVIAKYRRRSWVVGLIRDALDKHSFEVWYQPIWNRTIEGFPSAEALIRLRDGRGGYIPPDEFIRIAEEDGLIIPIGHFVLEEVCRFYRDEKLETKGVEYLEVNLSVAQCMNKRLADDFRSILEEYRVPSNRINLEVTESAAYDSRFSLLNTVNSLSGLGFAFSLDDYGTGYSNVSYMYDIPFTLIKLDKSILWSAYHPKTGEGTENARIYLESTLKMMKDMHYLVLVEGVETQIQKDELTRCGCDYLQGYFFSKPLPPKDYLDFLARQGQKPEG